MRKLLGRISDFGFTGWPTFVCVLGLFASGCIARDPAVVTPLQLRAPVPLAGTLAVLDSSRHRLMRLHPGTVNAIAQDEQPLDIVPEVEKITPDGKQVLWLNHALEKGKRRLAVLGPTGDAVTTLLPAAFSGLTIAEDSHAVVAFHAASAAQGGLVIAAELALVDLTASPLAPRSTVIAGLATAPLNAHLSLPVTAADGVHRVAWIDAVSALGIADFGPAGTRTLVVPLAAAGSSAAPTATLVPTRTVARVEGAQLHLYLVANGSNDAVHVTLDLSQPQLAASLDQVASGPSPVDLAVIDAGAGLRLLTVHNGANQLAYLNPATGTGTTLTLTSASHHIEKYTGADGKLHALLWGENNPLLQRVDLEDIEKKKGKAIHDLSTPQGIVQVTAVGSQFLLHRNSAELSVYDADQDRLTALTGTGQVKSVLTVGTTILVLGRVNVGMQLARIDVNKLSAESLDLQFPAQSVHVWGANGIALWSPGDGSGALLVFPDGALDLDSAHLAEGFGLAGSLNAAAAVAP